MNNNLAFRLLLLMIAGTVGASEGHGAADTGRPIKPAVRYEICVSDKGDSNLGLEITVRNDGASPIYIRAIDAPWISQSAIRLYFTTDLEKMDEPTTWEGDYRSPSHSLSVMKSERLEPGGAVSKTIPLHVWYPRVPEFRKRTNLYVNWNLKMRVYEENPDVRRDERSIPIDLDRTGGFLTLPMLQSDGSNVQKTLK
jgi:hypothetical protein